LITNRPEQTGQQDLIQKRLWSTQNAEYHQRQFTEPYRSIVHLCDFVREQRGDVSAPRTAVDVACGAGQNMFWLSRLLQTTTFLGIDIADDLLDLGPTLIRERDPLLLNRITFRNADLYHIPDDLYGGFDLAFSVQTLSWLPSYEEPMRQMVKVVRPGGILFVTSLFSRFLINTTTSVVGYSGQNLSDPNWGPHFYNVYSMERFKWFCTKLGAKDVVDVEFEIDIELECQGTGMGTYTRRLSEGKLLQFSGPMLMPWRFVAILL
jgi:ubiquinone/menaquinone biosynthesis C-methylase UbiE